MIDCLTSWLSKLMAEARDAEVEVTTLINALLRCRADIVFVSNEIGAGLVPMDALSRQFRDAQGRLNPRIAIVTDSVVCVAAGLPVRLY